MDMLDSVHKATTYLADQSYSDFLADMKTQDAVVRNLEILGEAAHLIPDTPYQDTVVTDR